ncbi:hypothetical protein NM688_g2991 [Phlebia brevispora]|uniref:Uncharacterized protein n=1 Tax=Phlebia brevispora TaxID=194682 RepID=A0ACC1T788_9APHY|nr:hypothetical protein NM688_g2991 [Phlebia brevispora]
MQETTTESTTGYASALSSSAGSSAENLPSAGVAEANLASMEINSTASETVVTITKTVKRTYSVDGGVPEVVEHTISQDFDAKEDSDDFIQDLMTMGWVPRGRNVGPSAVSKPKPPVGPIFKPVQTRPPK